MVVVVVERPSLVVVERPTLVDVLLGRRGVISPPVLSKRPPQEPA